MIITIQVGPCQCQVPLRRQVSRCRGREAQSPSIFVDRNAATWGRGDEGDVGTGGREDEGDMGTGGRGRRAGSVMGAIGVK